MSYPEKLLGEEKSYGYKLKSFLTKFISRFFFLFKSVEADGKALLLCSNLKTKIHLIT